ncbi:MAG: NAD(P)/FAD-dependent oxidoreductase, partial [Nocardioidaceae bacterium]
RVHYDKLLLATGSEPRRLKVPGADLDGVLYLRNLADSDAIKQAIEAGGPIVVVGAGWIGLEVTAAAREADVAVTVLEAAELPLQQALGDEVAQVFADLHREHGVDLRLGCGIASISGDDGRVTGVVAADGSPIEAATVIVGIGAEPRTSLAADADLVVSSGVHVDPHLFSSDAQILAAGDIAAIEHHVLHERIRVEHWANALATGPVAARSMLGQDVVLDELPYFFTDQYDLGMEYIGHADPATTDRVVLRGDVDGRAFHAFWLTGGTVRAGMHVNLWDDGIEPAKRLILEGRPVDPDRLADASVPLSEL